MPWRRSSPARLPRDRVDHQRPHDAEDDDRHNRAEVDRPGADAEHRDEAPEEVQVRVRDLADEVQDRVEPGVVRDAREPAHQHADEDEDDVDEEERVDVARDRVAGGGDDRHRGLAFTTASTASENAARSPPRSSAASPRAVEPPGEVTRLRRPAVSSPCSRSTAAVPAIVSTAMRPASSGVSPWRTPASTRASTASAKNAGPQPMSAVAGSMSGSGSFNTVPMRPNMSSTSCSGPSLACAPGA